MPISTSRLFNEKELILNVSRGGFGRTAFVRLFFQLQKQKKHHTTKTSHHEHDTHLPPQNGRILVKPACSIRHTSCLLCAFLCSRLFARPTVHQPKGKCNQRTRCFLRGLPFWPRHTSLRSGGGQSVSPYAGGQIDGVRRCPALPAPCLCVRAPWISCHSSSKPLTVCRGMCVRSHNTAKSLWTMGWAHIACESKKKEAKGGL